MTRDPATRTAASVRNATGDDLDAIADLGAASLASAWGREALVEARVRPGTLLLVTGPPGTVVGYLLARLVADEVEILELAVAGGSRRAGLGSALVERALAEAAHRGARSAHLEVRVGDAGAIRFYRERRFREIGRRPRYYRGGEDAIAMSRALGPPSAEAQSASSGGARGASSDGAQGASLTVLRVEAQVVANEADGATGRRLRLRVPGWPGARPGQFVMLSPGPLGAVPRSDPLLPRPMAVYRTLEAGDEIEILYKISGRGTGLLAGAEPGDRIGVVGPLGRGFAPPAEGEHGLLVGGGTGTASLLDQAGAVAARGRATVLLGARSEGELLGLAEFRALDVTLEIATEDGSAGHHGFVTKPLAKALAADPGAVVYACGPTPMMRAAAALAREHGARCFVSLENPMACGFGVCLGCAAPLAGGGFALVCRDGPVFAAEAVDWENLA